MMKFIPSNREDITRYYRNTFIKLKDFGDLLFYIENVDSLRVTGKCENGDPFCIYLDEDTPYEVEYILPHKSFFQNENDAVQLQRIPAKQYYRGICTSNTQMLFISATGQQKALDVNFNTLKKFVTKQPFSSLKAAMVSTANSIVLSPRMMYFRPKREIYIDFTPVAKVNPGKLQVTVTKPIFLDEVMELLKARPADAIFKVETYKPSPPKEKLKPEDLVKAMMVKPTQEVEW